jgi:Flp pilus assembly protein CpaB
MKKRLIILIVIVVALVVAILITVKMGDSPGTVDEPPANGENGQDQSQSLVVEDEVTVDVQIPEGSDAEGEASGDPDATVE